MFKALGNLIHEGVKYEVGRNYTSKELKAVPEFLRDEMFAPSEADIEVEEEAVSDDESETTTKKSSKK